MSTEHQRYSTANQADAIAKYASARGLEVVRTYCDAGKSGLTLDGRRELQALLQDVQFGEPDFGVLLVYDVSRWGRFQDADESAYYEYSCRRSGIRVIYVAEQFENDGTSIAGIVKSLKRLMAAEYSRDLSQRVFRAQCRMIRMGYKGGGAPGYGFRRLLVDEDGTPKGILKHGQIKNIKTDYVRLVLGSPEEQATVRRVYRLFVEKRRKPGEIAALLNREGIDTGLGRAWTAALIKGILQGEKYVGHSVFNRRSKKLKGPLVHNPPEEWLRITNAHPGIVGEAIFKRAQKIMAARSAPYSDEEALADLKALLDREGYLSSALVDAQRMRLTANGYRVRFGSLQAAAERIGHKTRNYNEVGARKRRWALHRTIFASIQAGFEKAGGHVTSNATLTRMVVDEVFSVYVATLWCHHVKGNRRWKLKLPNELADISIASRMDPATDQALDYFVLPKMDIDFREIAFGPETEFELEAYRFDDLRSVFGLAGTAKTRRQ